MSLRICLAATLSVAAAGAFAQQPATSPATAKPGATAAQERPRHATGDAWLDARLADIDAYAVRHPEAFADELQRYAGVPRAYVHGLLAQPGWGGGDAWFACFLARATGATCRSIVRERTRAGTDAGWEAVASGSGAGPGSEAYTGVRLALADSFRRWALPLQPDPALSRALRGRAEAAADPRP